MLLSGKNNQQSVQPVADVFIKTFYEGSTLVISTKQ